MKGFVNTFTNNFSGQASPTNRPHEWRLARLLEIAGNPDSNEAKRRAEKLINIERRTLETQVAGLPKELSEHHIQKFKKYRELLLTEAVESTTLIQAEFYNTVLEGAEPEKIIRNALRVIPMKTNQLTFTLGEKGGVLGKVAEGAELPDNQQNYTTVTLTSHKYGEKNMITNELIEDSLYDIIALEVAKAGARAENTLNHVVLTMLLDDAKNEHDTAGNNQGFKALSGARKEMEIDGYKPDVCIICAEAEKVLIDDSQLSYSAYYSGTGVSPVVARGQIPPIFGMRFYQLDPFDKTYNSDTHTWGYSADGEIGMVLVDSKSLAAVIGMRRDITVKNYDDPIRDLRGAALTMRFAEESPFDNGICRVVY